LDQKYHDEIAAQISADERVLNVLDALVGMNDRAIGAPAVIVTSERLILVMPKMRGRLNTWSFRWSGLHGVQAVGKSIILVFNDWRVDKCFIHPNSQVETDLLLATIQEAREYQEQEKLALAQNEMDKLRRQRGF
jgi:hypothetical protein